MLLYNLHDCTFNILLKCKLIAIFSCLERFPDVEAHTGCYQSKGKTLISTISFYDTTTFDLKGVLSSL